MKNELRLGAETNDFGAWMVNPYVIVIALPIDLSKKGKKKT